MFRSSQNLRLAAEMRALERVARPWREARTTWFDGTPESIEARLAATERVLTHARAGTTTAHLALEREASAARAELREAGHRLMVDFLDDGARAFKGSRRVAVQTDLGGGAGVLDMGPTQTFAGTESLTIPGAVAKGMVNGATMTGQEDTPAFNPGPRAASRHTAGDGPGNVVDDAFARQNGLDPETGRPLPTPGAGWYAEMEPEDRPGYGEGEHGECQHCGERIVDYGGGWEHPDGYLSSYGDHEAVPYDDDDDEGFRTGSRRTAGDGYEDVEDYYARNGWNKTPDYHIEQWLKGKGKRYVLVQENEWGEPHEPAWTWAHYDDGNPIGNANYPNADGAVRTREEAIKAAEQALAQPDSHGMWSNMRQYGWDPQDQGDPLTYRGEPEFANRSHPNYQEYLRRLEGARRPFDRARSAGRTAGEGHRRTADWISDRQRRIHDKYQGIPTSELAKAYRALNSYDDDIDLFTELNARANGRRGMNTPRRDHDPDEEALSALGDDFTGYDDEDNDPPWRWTPGTNHFPYYGEEEYAYDDDDPLPPPPHRHGGRKMPDGSDSPDEAESARYVLDFMHRKGIEELSIDDENRHPSYQRDFDDEEELDDAVAWVPRELIHNPGTGRRPWNPVLRRRDIEEWFARNPKHRRIPGEEYELPLRAKPDFNRDLLSSRRAENDEGTL